MLQDVHVYAKGCGQTKTIYQTITYIILNMFYKNKTKMRKMRKMRQRTEKNNYPRYSELRLLQINLGY